MNLARKVNIGRPKPPKLTELIEHFGLDEARVADRPPEWFGGGGAARRPFRYRRHLSVPAEATSPSRAARHS